MTDSGMVCMEHRYGTHELQRLAVWRFPEDARARFYEAALTNREGRTKYWFVYLHGGAWRDPRMTHLSAEPALNRLASGPMRDRIAGFASISYRLSRHPLYRQETSPAASSERERDRLRDARHPDHIDDVRRALRFLDTHYGFDGTFSYILCGHSCGATLALQFVMDLPRKPSTGAAATATTATTTTTTTSSRSPFPYPEPHAVVGFEGLYDLPGLVGRRGPAYRDFVAGAFGEDEEVWRQMSPARFRERWLEEERTYNRLCHLLVLAWSPEDELVDGAEIDGLEAALRQHYFGVTKAYRDLRGRHDDMVADGGDIARVLAQTVEELDQMQDHLGRPDIRRARARRDMANEEAAGMLR